MKYIRSELLKKLKDNTKLIKIGDFEVIGSELYHMKIRIFADQLTIDEARKILKKLEESK